MFRGLAIGSALAMVLATSATADVIPIVCTAPPSYVFHVYIDTVANTVTDDVGTWAAQITADQVTWTGDNGHGRMNSYVYDRNTARLRGRGLAYEMTCIRGAPKPF